MMGSGGQYSPLFPNIHVMLGPSRGHVALSSLLLCSSTQTPTPQHPASKPRMTSKYPLISQEEQAIFDAVPQPARALIYRLALQDKLVKVLLWPAPYPPTSRPEPSALGPQTAAQAQRAITDATAAPTTPPEHSGPVLVPASSPLQPGVPSTFPGGDGVVNDKDEACNSSKNIHSCSNSLSNKPSDINPSFHETAANPPSANKQPRTRYSRDKRSLPKSPGLFAAIQAQAQQANHLKQANQADRPDYTLVNVPLPPFPGDGDNVDLWLFQLNACFDLMPHRYPDARTKSTAALALLSGWALTFIQGSSPGSSGRVDDLIWQRCLESWEFFQERLRWHLQRGGRLPSLGEPLRAEDVGGECETALDKDAFVKLVEQLSG